MPQLFTSVPLPVSSEALGYFAKPIPSLQTNRYQAVARCPCQDRMGVTGARNSVLILGWSWACWPLSHLIWWSTSRLFLLSAWGSQTPALLVASLELVHVFQVGWFDSKHHDGEAILIDVVPIKHIQHCPWGILALTNYHRLSQLFRCNEYLMAKFIIHISRHNIPLMYPLFNHCPWATRTGVTLVKKTIDKHGRTRIATWLWLGLWALLNLISGVLTMVLSYTFFPKT